MFPNSSPQNARSSADSNEVSKDERQTHQKEKKIDLFLFTNDTNIYRKFQEVWNLLAEISELNQLQKIR